MPDLVVNVAPTHLSPLWRPLKKSRIPSPPLAETFETHDSPLPPLRGEMSRSDRGGVLTVTVCGTMRMILRSVFHVMFTVIRLRHVEPWIAVEEAPRLQAESCSLHRHHRPVLGSHDVVHPDRVPEHDVGLLQRTIRRNPTRHPLSRLTLRREVASGVALRRLICRHPELLPSKRRPLSDQRLLISHHRHRRSRCQHIRGRLADRVAEIIVRNPPVPRRG